ncbi:lipid A core - O-antigen ligase [Rubidibacter lacunae KORDI 51-2]|uniref:Lipid A core-O-antigen ligase n=1 Tax=Rubidibacter lacunae KORDI 51-2 TaxID=582515 RepID=U5DI93_9CHRO|nr:O-antigen ligase family protein [Rubidibacter lacunae]ERN40319.1 lipid A core - O-antigen ligase [Rubidibacter lacunae KORDI 51-2]
MDDRLQTDERWRTRAWHWQVGATAILPLLPTWGALSLVGVVVAVWARYWRRLLGRPLMWGWALLAAWLIVTACCASDRGAAWLGLANVLPFVAMYAATSALVQRPEQLRVLAVAIAAPAAIAAVLGLGQIWAGWTTPPAWEPVLGWTLVAGGNPPGRLASAFMYANICAVYLLVGLALGVMLVLDAWQQLQRWLLVAAFGGTVAIAAALGLTASRNAWALGLLVGLAYAVFLGWRWLVAAAIAIAAVVAGASFAPPSPLQQGLRAIVPDYVWLRLSDRLHPDRPEALLRSTQWEFAWQLARARPWTGWGLRSFTPLYQDRTDVWLGHPHNLPLMLFAETGIPATLLLVAMVGSVMVRTVRLLWVWPALAPMPGSGRPWHRDRLVLFGFAVAFSSCTLFNLLDVTLFDLRANAIAWLLLGAIDGVTHRDR